ncbi:hypothetical protein [Bacillus sp. NEB1478]|uniref:hypothetical protein n=1 Tax=Bacillus sp. NEB1478 TaxID=3073816 RepID=UPI0028731EB2|nr:hypothetical protein [Bacillus sp. NEB1478]WNB93550.1 hypothetical protein RGB74_07760 [Bacillus sp. NEB1478]
MIVYYGYEKGEDCSYIEVVDKEQDLIIVSEPLSLQESVETIPLLLIQPKKTTILFEDYGFFSDNQNCYLYLDMICAFSITRGNEHQISMFLLQVEEELIAIHEEKSTIFLLGRHHEPLIKKWASSYLVEIDFLIS